MSRPISEKVTVIGYHKCSDCGSLQPVKVNKNGRGYFFCAGSDPNGEACRVEHKLSPFLSAKMIATYRNEIEPANTNADPDAETAPSEGGTWLD